MSEQKNGLAEAIASEVFGQQVGAVANYLCKWRRGTLTDIVGALSPQTEGPKMEAKYDFGPPFCH